jgi:HD-GYP domain-containing protein (c-di-GMP phosphodiesterase class II)
LSVGAIESLVIALEAKDKYTAGHSRRVTEISIAIAKEMGLSEKQLDDVRWGSLLHDEGKIAVNQLIQNKPGTLNKDEYEHIMIHAYVGAGIVKPVVFLLIYNGAYYLQVA